MTAAGVFLWGAPVAMKALGVDTLPQELNVWCIKIGLFMNVGGALCTGLFGRDNDVSSDHVASIQKQKADTDFIQKPPDK